MHFFNCKRVTSPYIVERVNVAVQPVLRFHILTGFGIGVVAARQYCNEQVRRTLLTSHGIVHRKSIPSPVHWMAPPCWCWMRMVVFVTRAQFQYLLPNCVFMCGVFPASWHFWKYSSYRFPRQCQLPVNVGVIRFYILTDLCMLVGKKVPPTPHLLRHLSTVSTITANPLPRIPPFVFSQDATLILSISLLL